MAETSVAVLHILWWKMCSGFYHHLCLRVLRTHTGRSQFDHLSELGDGLGWGLGGLGQFLLAGRSTSNQQLGVLHQRLGCLQDALSEGWRDTLYHNLLHGHTQVPAIWKEAVAFLTECVLSKEHFKFGSSCEMNPKIPLCWQTAHLIELSEEKERSVSKPSNRNLVILPSCLWNLLIYCPFLTPSNISPL